MKKILFVFGTRPEAVKMASLIKKVESNSSFFHYRICVTAQHREMLDQVLRFFEIQTDYDLNLMSHNQTLFDITSSPALKKMGAIIEEYNPDFIIVQGDTTTALMASLAGYYLKKKIVHIEAGLRSHNKYSPFPEEMNRVLIDHIADYYFVPTKNAKENLVKEGINKNIWIVGNTVIDSLFLGLKFIKKSGEQKYFNYFKFVDLSKRIILVTIHRRESFGKPIQNIANSLKMIAGKFKDIRIVIPVHPNPNVRKPIYETLGEVDNIKLIEPLDYPHLIWVMKKSYIILTDSGGIQEEAPSLKKPVLVLRDVTERTEGIKAGNAKLTGTAQDRIFTEVKSLLTNGQKYNKMIATKNPYGDGKACDRIIRIILNSL